MNKYHKTIIVLIVVAFITLSLGITSSLVCLNICKSLSKELSSASLETPESLDEFKTLWDCKSPILHMITKQETVDQLDDIIATLDYLVHENLLAEASNYKDKALRALDTLGYMGIPILTTIF